MPHKGLWCHDCTVTMYALECFWSHKRKARKQKEISTHLWYKSSHLLSAALIHLMQRLYKTILLSVVLGLVALIQEDLVVYNVHLLPPHQSTSSIPPWQVGLLLWPYAEPLSPVHCSPRDQSHRQHRQLLLQWSPWWPVWKWKNRCSNAINLKYPNFPTGQTETTDTRRCYQSKQQIILWCQVSS